MISNKWGQLKLFYANKSTSGDQGVTPPSESHSRLLRPAAQVKFHSHNKFGLPPGRPESVSLDKID